MIPLSFMRLGERRGAGTLRSLELEISFLPLRSPKHTLMFGKKARVVGQTVLFACVVRKTAPARVTSLSAWQMASVIRLASLMALASEARQRLARSRWQADSRVVSV